MVYRELWMEDWIFLIVTKGLLDLIRIRRSSTPMFTANMSLVDMLLLI